jgi:hypothetical protein
VIEGGWRVLNDVENGGVLVFDEEGVG